MSKFTTPEVKFRGLNLRLERSNQTSPEGAIIYGGGGLEIAKSQIVGLIKDKVDDVDLNEVDYDDKEVYWKMFMMKG